MASSPRLALADVAVGSALHAQGTSFFYKMNSVTAPLGKALGDHALLLLASGDCRHWLLSA